MNFNQKEYIEEVLSLIAAPRKVKKRIKEDLDQRINESKDDDVYYDVYSNMGTPEELAEEFNSNLESDINFYGVSVGLSRSYNRYEYKSKKTIFGLPLIHINTGGAYLNKKAKGIIAIGDISVGVISIGGVSFGVFSIGGIGIGLISLAGVAIGGLAFGGVAVGAYAFGAVAIGIVRVFGAVMHLLS